jgi:2-desacetyl-2-hydroxyethyl bacteriochlorophyllide A dehydrogenase
MKAIRMVEVGKPLVLREIPVPDTDDHEVLVQVKAAGICHSDVHYRAGISAVGDLPQTLGHEVAGVVTAAGSRVRNVGVGDRVCLHYLLSCGDCHYCSRGSEQFCHLGQMIGKDCDGGYAEYIAIPARSVVPLPKEIPFDHGAVLMCSSSTSFHALHKAQLRAGETVAVFGAGGLGMSAIQLARAMGALTVYVVDINAEKLALAAGYGAVPVNAAQVDPVTEIKQLTGGRGVDVALEVIGLARTMQQAVQVLGVFGRAVLAGITDRPLPIDTYSELLGKEAQVIGCSDHLLQELPLLLAYAQRGDLDLSEIVTNHVPLTAGAINEVLDRLEQFGSGPVRTVIIPEM